MNKREFKCVEILTDLIENHGMVGIKTSFEDEGALFNETVRLKQICSQAGTEITLKIGGPEAIRDMKDGLVIGVKGIVAPMVESEFGLKKFVSAANTYIPPDLLSLTNLYVNVETITSIKNAEDMMKSNSAKQLHGVTIGRVDLVSSMNKDRSYVDSDEIYGLTENTFKKVKDIGLKACIGGAVSVNSFEFLNKLNSNGLLDKFETRYVMFDPSVSLKDFNSALSKAQMFEYEWLVAKKEYYESIANQDSTRIKMIHDRMMESI
jgi:hypothetical protein